MLTTPTSGSTRTTIPRRNGKQTKDIGKSVKQGQGTEHTPYPYYLYLYLYLIINDRTNNSNEMEVTTLHME